MQVMEHTIFRTDDVHPAHYNTLPNPDDYPHALHVRCLLTDNRESEYLLIWLEKNMTGDYHHRGPWLFLSSDVDLIAFKMMWG